MQGCGLKVSEFEFHLDYFVDFWTWWKVWTLLSTTPSPSSPVVWGCWIYQLHICRGLRPPYECPEYNTKLHLVVRLQSRSFEECKMLLNLHGSTCKDPNYESNRTVQLFTTLKSFDSVQIKLLAFDSNTWRCPWCNGYHCRKWTWWHEFKSWTRLIAFHIALIPLGKVWIQIFSLQLWVNSRTD